MGEHIGKLHLNKTTRGPNRDDYLDEAKKYIRKIGDSGEQSSATSQQNGSSSARSSAPFPTGPFFCCDRTFGNLYNLNKHQSSRKCVMKNQKQPQEVEKEQDTSFSTAAAAAVAAFSQHSNFSENGFSDEDGDVDAAMMVKTEAYYDDSDD